MAGPQYLTHDDVGFGQPALRPKEKFLSHADVGFDNPDALSVAAQDAARPGARILQGLKDAGTTLLSGTAAAADMIVGAPASLAGKVLNAGTRLRAIAGGESRQVQGLAGQEAEEMIPEEMKKPFQTLLKATGVGEIDQSIVMNAINSIATTVAENSKGTLTAEDAQMLLGAGMDAGGVVGLRHMVKTLTAPKPQKSAVREEALPEGPSNAPRLENYGDLRRPSAPIARAEGRLSTAPLEGEFIRVSEEVPRLTQAGQADPKLLAMIAAAGGLAAFTLAYPDEAKQAMAGGLLAVGVTRGRSVLSHLEESALVERAKAGDQAAFTEIYNREAPRLERVLTRYVGDPAKAQDLVQDTMESAFRALKKPADEPGGFKGDSKLGTWLYGNALNKAKDSFRRADSRVQTVSERDLVAPEDGGVSGLDTASAKAGEAAPGADAAMENAQLREHLQRGLDKLDPDFRAAFEGRELEGKSYEELAAEQGVPVGTIRSRIFRAKEALQKHMGQAGAVEKGVLKGIAGASLGAAAYLADPENAGRNAALAAAILAIKEKGGMWHPEAVERLSQPLMKSLAYEVARNPDGSIRAPEDISARAISINTWVPKAVRNYLNKHAGTATDPLKDVEVPFGEGTERWEKLTDSVIKGREAGTYGQNMPVGSKPGETIWQVERGMNPQQGIMPARAQPHLAAITSYLSHVGDYLREHVPAEKLGQYDLVRAVKETVKWDKELAKNMEKAQLAEKGMAPIYKEYPDGMYWQQLTKPGQFARESDAMEHSIRKYEPMGPITHQNQQGRAFLPDEQSPGHPDWIPASGHSGDPGYSLGGWEAIKRGNAKIYSLRDANGKSHATVEVDAGKTAYPFTDSLGPKIWPEFYDGLSETTQRAIDANKEATSGKAASWSPVRLRQEMPEVWKQFEKFYAERYPDEPQILQIKGKRNRAPSAEYLPYVQDFVKSGKWGEVGDLGNADMHWHKGELATTAELRKLIDEGDLSDPDTARLAGTLNYIPRSQRGSVDPKLLGTLAFGTGAAALGAYLDSDKPLRGATLGALGIAGLGALSKGGAGKGLDYALGTISTRIGNISVALKLRARNYERVVMERTDKSLDRIDPFIRGIRKIPKAAQETLNTALLANDKPAVESILRAVAQGGGKDLRGAYAAVNTLLDEFRVEQVGMERFRQGLSDYFPRIVKDLDGLKAALNQVQRTHLEKTLAEAEAKMVKEQQRGLTDVERSLIVNRSLQATGSSAQLPGFAKARGVKNLTSDLAQFYVTPTESLLRYVSGAVQDAQMAKFFGKNLASKKVGSKLATNVDESIGNIVQEEMRAGRLKAEGAEELRSILKSRFEGGEQSMTGLLQDVRNATNVGLLGGFHSAATQIGDSIMTVYHHGLMPTLGAVKQKLTGSAQISTKEFGLVNHIAEELGSARLSGRVLQTVFKASGFQLIDQFAKGLNLNAGLLKNQKLARSPEGIAKLTAKYGEAFGAELPQLIDDLRAGRKTENVKSLLFSELSDAQPLTKMELPQAYLDHPNGRLLYQMKTYMLKQMDVIRRDAYQELAKGNYVKGAKNLVAVAAALSLSNVPGDIVKDWLSGRAIDLTKIDHVENLLQNFGINRYTLDKARSGKPLETAVGMITPPYKHFQDLGGMDTKSLKYLPGPGRMIYDRYYGGNEDRRTQELIREKRDKRSAQESQYPILREQRLRRQERALEIKRARARSGQ